MRKPGDDVNEAKEESAAHRVAALLRADAIQTVDDQPRPIGWQELRLSKRSSATSIGCYYRAPRAGGSPVGFAVAVGALAVAGGSRFRTFLAEPLTFQIDGREPADAQLASGAGETRRLDFSDGVEAPAAPLGTASDSRRRTPTAPRWSSTEASSMSPSGTARRPDGGLSVGPYTVKVTGTRFKASWDLETAEIRVDTLEGAVTVEGPGMTRPVVVAGGQQFRATDSEPRAAAARASASARLPAATRRKLTLPIAGRRSNGKE